MKKAMPVSIDTSMAEWVNSIAQGEEFRNRSHVVERAIMEFRRKVTAP